MKSQIGCLCLLFAMLCGVAFADDRQNNARHVEADRATEIAAAMRGLADQLNQAAAGKSSQKSTEKSGAGESLDTTMDLSGVSVQATEGGLVINGPAEAVEAMMRVITEIDRLSLGLPEIRVVPLKHADSEATAKLLTSVYDTRTSGATGEAAAAQHTRKVGFVAIAQPNAVVVLAQAAEIGDVVKFVQSLDAESAQVGVQYKVFPLKHASAPTVAQTLQQFFQITRENLAGLRVRVDVVADARINAVIVHAGPDDMIKAEALIRQLDGEGDAINEMRVFPLKHAVASELAVILQQAIVYRSQLFATGQTRTGQGAPSGQQAQGQPLGQQFGPQGGLPTGQQGQLGGLGAQSGLSATKSARLRFLTTDRSGKPVESGILEDVSVFADDRTNSLIVTAPSTSMTLVAELIRQLDAQPGPISELKVFTLKNADATAMLTTLQSIFQTQQTGQGAGGALGSALSNRAQQVTFSLTGGEGALSLVPVNLSVDVRTNSILASGSRNDLVAVEAVILRLDSDTARERKIIVYPLRNLTAEEAGQAIDDFLEEQTSVGTTTTTGGQDGLLTVQQQIRNEVTVTPEPVSNNLLISTTPRFEDELMQLLEAIDRRPPQVVIQVLIAEVMLNDDEELGLEAGVQSSVLFDRSLRVSNTASAENSLTPGFNFNTTDPLQTPVEMPFRPVPASEVGLQGLSNFGLGRAAQQGFGGLIFAASSDNLSILLRALKRQQRLEVLSRPQIMTADNQSANINIGQNVPIVTGFTIQQFGVVNEVEREDVGVLLEVTPRISPDDVVLMRVIPTVSSLAGVGVPIGTANGEVIESPIINQITAETTIAARDGQTVVLGGLMRSEKSRDVRKIPFLGDIPILGWASKTRFKSKVKQELLIILTPHIVHDDMDAQYIKDVEARRINWILSDVEKMHGSIGLSTWPGDDDPSHCDACKESGELCTKHKKRRGRRPQERGRHRATQIVDTEQLRRSEIVIPDEAEMVAPEQPAKPTTAARPKETTAPRDNTKLLPLQPESKAPTTKKVEKSESSAPKQLPRKATRSKAGDAPPPPPQYAPPMTLRERKERLE